MNGLFGYGRKKINKLDCKLCISKKNLGKMRILMKFH